MTRKQDKLRPYRIDYLDIEEMKGDLALVRSAITRATTATDAVRFVVQNENFHEERFVLIRAYRYYKTLPSRKTVYKPVGDLFPTNKAVKVMEQVEAYHTNPAPKNGAKCPTCGLGIDDNGDGDCPVCTSPVYKAMQVKGANGHITRFSDSSLYDEVCKNCGATDTSGDLGKPCPVASTPAVAPLTCPYGYTKEHPGTVHTCPIHSYADYDGDNVPTSGPDSPPTKAVIADLNGMISHDAHEQAMDTFVLADVPEGKRFPDPANVPITAPQPTADVAEQPDAKPKPEDFGIIEPNLVVGPEGRPPLHAVPMADANNDTLLSLPVTIVAIVVLAAVSAFAFFFLGR